MAFEKMTAGALYNEFVKLFPNIIGEKYDKIGARMLRIETCAGPVLYFLWYDGNNWNLGTKPYRNRPVKQMYKKLKEQNTFADLKKDVECLPQGVDLTKMDLDLKTLVAAAAISTLTGTPLSDEEQWKEDVTKAMNMKRYETMKVMNEQRCAEITSCNQEPMFDPEELDEKVNAAIAKPDSEDEMPEGCIHVTCPHPEPIEWTKDN